MSNPYDPVVILNFNATPPSDDGSEVESNQLDWDFHLDKIGTPLKNLAEGIDTNVRAAFDTIDNGFPDDLQRLNAVGDGAADDTVAIQAALDLWTQGVVTANPALTVPFGSYKIIDTLTVPDSASQWTLTGEGSARSSSIQATSALAGLPMFSATNLRESNIANIEFLGDSGSKPSHGIKVDRDSASQTGSGGPGLVRYKGLLFRNVEIGFEPVQAAGGNNDQHMFTECIFGGGIDKYGVVLTNTNAAWVDLNQCRFDGCGYADISSVVAIGSSRGGSFVSNQCRHISGEVAYHIGASRAVTIIAPRMEQHDQFIVTSDKKLVASTLSADSSDDSFNDSAASLPVVAEDDYIYVRGFSDSANNGVFQVGAAPTTSKIVVTSTLVSESAGSEIELMPTKMKVADESSGTTVTVYGGEITTTDAISLLFDSDDEKFVLNLIGVNLATTGGKFVFPGAATVNIIGGQLGASTVEYNGRLSIIGTVQSSGTVTFTNLGAGQLYVDPDSNIRGALSDPITFTDGDTTPSVNGGRVFRTNNTSPTTITVLDDGYVGKQITIRFGDNNTTIEHGTSAGQVNFRDSANVTFRGGQTLKLYRTTTDSWVETNSFASTDLYPARSDGDTGGSGSAGTGNQYIEIEVNGTTYKVLHDGTV